MEARDALFSKTQQRLIGALFSDAGASGLTYAEILRRTKGGAGAIHRELGRLQEAGLVVRARDGKALVPNRKHPIHGELRAIARKLGLEEPAAGREPDRALFTRLARKYLWWVDPAEALQDEDHLLAQVMNLGTFEDSRLIEERAGKARLRRVLQHAKPGQFDEKSWTHWHYRLGAAKVDRVPPLPRRAIPE